jgi:methylthioribulose-1-phosphate dehydratase
VQTAIDSLIEAGRWLDARGYAPATSGNYSVRLGPGRILVTASGRHKGRLGRGDFVVIDEEGRKVEGPEENHPSAEAALHAAMFRLDRRIGAVLHTHSVCATVLGMALGGAPGVQGGAATTHGTTLDLTGYEMLKALPGISTHEATVKIPVFDNSQDVALLARQVESRWHDGPFPGYMLRGHGLYAWGNDLHLAMRSAEALEFLVACELERRKVTP